MIFSRASSPLHSSRTNDTIPFTDLSLQWRQIEAKLFPDIRRLFEDSVSCLGPFVERFEHAVAEYTGAGHAIGVNSGTSALHLALITAGVRPGDKVLLPTAWAAHKPWQLSG
jgi:dTDP-4-amino-4,6-dideoxygalactose transaminase